MAGLAKLRCHLCIARTRASGMAAPDKLRCHLCIARWSACGIERLLGEWLVWVTCVALQRVSARGMAGLDTSCCRLCCTLVLAKSRALRNVVIGLNSDRSESPLRRVVLVRSSRSRTRGANIADVNGRSPGWSETFEREAGATRGNVSMFTRYA